MIQSFPEMWYTTGVMTENVSNRSILVLLKPSATQRPQGIHRLAGECGWTVRTESIAAPPEDWSGDGVIVMLDGSPGLMRYVKRLRARRIPVVDVLEDRPDVRMTRVTGDDVEIGRLAAEHFNERDFRHAAFFSESNDYCHALRLKGFKKAWRGKTFESWLWPGRTDVPTGGAANMQGWLAGKLKAAPQPLAVFAWNDADAVHVLNACRTAGLKVPEDVAIVGVDNKEMICEHQSVRLSSIAHNLPRIGYVAAAMLERLMSGGRAPRQLTRIKPQGVVTRESTGIVAVNDPELRPVMTYIQQHLSQPLGAAQIADALGMPRVRLDRLFAAKLGRSVGAEIAARRIAKAKNMLKATGLPVDAIGARCGYCNTSFFARSFRKAVGTTPLAWRKRQ